MNTKSLGTICIAGNTFEVFEIIPLMDHDRGVNINIGYDSFQKDINKYGDSLFCHFDLDPKNPYCDKHGLYCFMVGNSVKYIGECSGDNYCFKRRIDDYGRIQQKKGSFTKCKDNGQSTDCRINALINKALEAGSCVRIGFCSFDGEKDEQLTIKEAEKKLLKFRFEWNIQLC